MIPKASRVLVSIACLSMFVIVFLSGIASAGSYSPCRVPPIVGVGAKPNVMFVVDYSGSMQFPAYFADNYDGYYSSKVADCYDTGTSQVYVPTTQYYGTFDTDTYYTYDSTNDYFVKADPQPELYYRGTADSIDGGGGTIEFTCDGHNFQVGNFVALYDLSSHKGLNGDAHAVVAVSGNKFKINATWNGKADAKGYKAIKRITGNTTVGINGNVLNLAVTSRIDAALKAIIGGKALCPTGDSYCYVQSQGARRYVSESTNIFADFYVRPATLQSPPQAYPDDYDTGTYITKDIFITISGQYRGQLDANDPVVWDEYTEPYTFTLTRTTKVIIKLQGTWLNGKGSRIAVYATLANFTGTNTKAAESASAGSNTTTLTADLAAGTYYLRIAPNTQLLPGEVPASYTLWSNVELTKYTGLHANAADHQGTALTAIGAIPWARVRIKTPIAERKGIVHEAFDFVRFGFMYYKGDEADNKGKILVGCENTSIDRLINAMEGRDTDASDGLDFTQAFPYYGTPTGPALQECWDYFHQNNDYTGATNTTFVSSSTKTTSKDPYYSPDATGTLKPVPCRKTFVILISDGEWNEGTDPVQPARKMHTEDMRTETGFSGNQVADVYSIFAFSQAAAGINSMKAVAMYGAFRHIDGCGTDATYPYPKTAVPPYPSYSLGFTWPVAECNPNGTYNTTCCAEWDSVWDRDGDGTNEDKGIPDTYFQADDGKKLQAALEAVLAEVVSKTASASAVATVSQELATGDVIIRGVFDAADPNVVDKYLWYGHLETYRPFEYLGEEKYDFEIPCNQGLICIDLPGTGSGCAGLSRHCWDSGELMSKDQEFSVTTGSPRTLFTYLNKTKTSFVWTDATGPINRTVLDVTSDAEAQNLINWVLGAKITGKRDRASAKISNKQWILGDIVYSTPVVVGPPRLGDVSTRDPDVQRFRTYRNSEIERDRMVYVGANDGMLHAFLLAKYREVTKADGTTEKKWIYDPAEDPDTSGPKIGEELWAYIPSNLLTELKNLEDSNYGVGDCKHRPMVDLSPRSWEVFIKSANCPAKTTHPELTDDLGRCWRTVVVGGERGGGDMYFALDVTDPHNPEVLWEYSVFRNRIVVEAQDTLNDSCFQPCKNACATKQECVDIYNNCVTTNHCATLWPRRLRSQCYANCTALQDQCIAQCESACRTACSTTTYKAYMPFDNDARYRTIKVIPMSWSQPYLGRIKVPDDVKFFVGPPSNAGDLITGGYPQNTFEFAPTGTPDVPSGTTSPFTVTLENQRSVVFMGGGIRIFDRDFDVPGFTSTEMRFKTALFWPFLIMMDIETGYNLFEYVWPMVVLKNSSVFPLVTTGTASNPFYVPYAMSDPLALDLWDQDTDTIGDDGFIDRVYVGDMNGYLYGVKFNLDPQVKDASGALVNNSNFGILVELWPTKPIDSGDLDMNLYRGRRQPITVQPASTFVKRSDSIYVIFGTGKYDDIFTDLDDKTDTSKMSLYNVKDVVSLPDLTGGYEVFDTSHPTGFKMKFENMCPGVTFDTGCTWFDQGSDPPRGDCCESGNSTCTNPCYACIYDLTLPTGDTGGERIVGKPLIAGGLVFVTSFVPPDETCDFSGEGYLYVFDAACIPLEDVTTIIPGASSPALVALGFGSGATRVDYGLRLSLGAGMPSRPVLDSRGENVIIQMSDGTLKRIGVGLPGKPVQVKGWRATR